MSRTFCFSVLCPFGRRETVKVTPNTSILQVLEEACSKQSLNPADFDLCHYNKPLDLSLPVRFSNLPNNALLELNPIKKARVESKVTVGLQLESGERFMKDFTPSSSLQEVIEQCLSSRTDVPMQVEAAGEPVCIYMRQKLVGDAIKNTTLRSLGLTTGKAIIRLLYRDPEEMTKQAHESAPLKKSVSENPTIFHDEQHATKLHCQSNTKPLFGTESAELATSTSIKHETIKTEDANSSGVDLPKNIMSNEVLSPQVSVSPTPMFESGSSKSANLTASTNSQDSQLASQTKDIKMETNETEQLADVAEIKEEIGDIIYIGDRHAVLYNLEDITDVKRADLPDEFFELTIADVRYLMDEYRRERVGLENQPLMIGAQRKNKLLEQLSHYRNTIIRVYFPERLVLQAVFSVEETVQSVLDFTRSFIEEKDLNFYLYITPPKQKLCMSKTLLEVALVPAANIYLGCETQRNSYLMNELRSRTSDPRAAALAASNARKESFCDTSLNILSMAVPESSSSAITMPQPTLNANSSEQTRNEPRITQGKVPKWMKLSK